MANRTSARRCGGTAASVLVALGLAAGTAQAGFKTIHPAGFSPASQGAATASTHRRPA